MQRRGTNFAWATLSSESLMAAGNVPGGNPEAAARQSERSLMYFGLPYHESHRVPDKGSHTSVTVTWQMAE